MNDLRLVPLSDVNKMGVGETVPRTKGTIKSIGKRGFGGEGEKQWSYEFFTLADNGVEVTGKLKNMPPMDQSLKGKSVWLFGRQTEKHGITGLKIDEYQGKKQLVITASATIMRADAVSKVTEPPVDNVPPDEFDSLPKTPPAQKPDPEKYIPMGQTIGMAINNACNNLTHRNLPLDPKDLASIASDILRVSKWLEDGNLTPKGIAPPPEPTGVRCIRCQEIVSTVDDTGECEACAMERPPC